MCQCQCPHAKPFPGFRACCSNIKNNNIVALLGKPQKKCFLRGREVAKGPLETRWNLWDVFSIRYFYATFFGLVSVTRWGVGWGLVSEIPLSTFFVSLSVIISPRCGAKNINIYNS